MSTLPVGTYEVPCSFNFIEQLADDQQRRLFITDIATFYKERMEYWQMVAVNNGWTRTEFQRYCQGAREGIMLMLSATDNRPANLSSYRLTTANGQVIGFDPSVRDEDTPGLIVAFEKEIAS